MIQYDQRKRSLQERMSAAGIDGFVMTQNVDLYYWTGSMQTGYLMIPAEGEAVFFVRRSVIRAQEESAVHVEELGPLRTLGDRIKRLVSSRTEDGKAPVLAAEFDVLPVAAFERLKSAIPGVDWTDGSAMIRETRMIKSPYEIAKIKEAAYAADVALEKAIAGIRPGMSEYELMSLIELSFRLNGHLGLMRMRGYNQEIVTGMVGSGWAAAKPTYFDGPAGGLGMSAASPQSASRKSIERNEPILVDIGCCIDGYVIDQTRTLVIGELEEDLVRAYAISERILRETETLLRPGTICQDLYAHALDIAREAGLADHFMGFGADQVKFLGHGIGLEIDEWPVLAKGFVNPLQAGMVVAVEPKFVFPGCGVVGIENSYAITESGFEKLTFSREGIIRIE